MRTILLSGIQIIILLGFGTVAASFVLKTARRLLTLVPLGGLVGVATHLTLTSFVYYFFSLTATLIVVNILLLVIAGLGGFWLYRQNGLNLRWLLDARGGDE